MGIFSTIGGITAKKSEFDETNDYIAELQRKIDADKPRTEKQKQQDTAGGSVIYLKAIGEKIGITFSEQFLAECGKLELEPEEIVALATAFKDDGYSSTPSIKTTIERGVTAKPSSNSSLSAITACIASMSNTCRARNTQPNSVKMALKRLYPDYSDEQVNAILDKWREKLS